MGNDSYPVLLTGSTSTTLGSCRLFNICINQALAGTMVVKETATPIGSFAIGAVAGNYHQNANGARYGNLVITLSAGDNVTVYICKA